MESNNISFINIIINIFCGLIVGIFLASISKPLYIYHGPDSNIIRKQIYSDKNQYYRLVPEIVSFGINT